VTGISHQLVPLPRATPVPQPCMLSVDAGLTGVALGREGSGSTLSVTPVRRPAPPSTGGATSFGGLGAKERHAQKVSQEATSRPMRTTCRSVPRMNAGAWHMHMNAGTCMGMGMGYHLSGRARRNA
jgi:hypothetical protein